VAFAIGANHSGGEMNLTELFSDRVMASCVTDPRLKVSLLKERETQGGPFLLVRKCEMIQRPSKHKVTK
jgi:hypothetical protein